MDYEVYIKEWKDAEYCNPTYSIYANSIKDGKKHSLGEFVYNNNTNEYEFWTDYDPVIINQECMVQMVELLKGLNK